MFENLVVKVPDNLYLRAYAYQLLGDSYGMSKRFREYLCSLGYGFTESTYGLDYWAIFNSISDEDFESLLSHFFYELPKYFIYFKSKEYKPEEESADYEYENIPRLFTNIIDVIFNHKKEVKYLIMELYDVQIYSLYDSDGNRLTDYCNDLDFGKYNNLILRTTSSCVWEHYKIKGEELEMVDMYEPSERLKKFPYRGRVEVEVFHPDKNKIPELRLKKREGRIVNANFCEDFCSNEDLDDLDKIFGDECDNNGSTEFK